MNKFLQYCNQVSILDAKAREDLLEKLKTKTFQKGEYILKADEVCKYMYFVDTGLTKLFFYKGDKEFIMTFFRENNMFTELNGFLTQRLSKYRVLALETTSIQFIFRNDIEKLCEKYHCIETLFRKLFSIASINMIKRITEMLEENAATRYNNFITENNDLLQRISLGDLANYLGITQVSLSRIRAAK